ncbi:rna-binding domain-containing protein [Ceraceosorus bombacis]|uniref:Rna-binding domain-containing protein n=1 Tax=Ceraceosorus bombacis TaxID=401625 RepID=A0A0P1BCI6_9BASI|nr:rna-binding domain-containing protein [Ceraceosorus bombacis]
MTSRPHEGTAPTHRASHSPTSSFGAERGNYGMGTREQRGIDPIQALQSHRATSATAIPRHNSLSPTPAASQAGFGSRHSSFGVSTGSAFPASPSQSGFDHGVTGSTHMVPPSVANTAGKASSPRSFDPSIPVAGGNGGQQTLTANHSPLRSFASAQSGSSSDHSRHSSGYASSLGLGGNANASHGGSATGSSTLGGHAYTPHQSLRNSSASNGHLAQQAEDTSVEAAIAAATKNGQPLTPSAIHAAAAAIAASSNRPLLRSNLSDNSSVGGGASLLPVSPGSTGIPASSLSGGISGTDEVSVSSSSTSGPLSASDPRTQLYISNLPYRVRWQDLKDLIRKAGTVLRADVSLTPDNRSRGYGTVLLATEEDALRAVNMFKGFSWQGRTLEVRIDRSGTLLLPTTPVGEEGSGQSGLLDVPNPSMSLLQGDSPHGLSNSAPRASISHSPNVPSPGSGMLPSPAMLNTIASGGPANAVPSPGLLDPSAASSGSQGRQLQQYRPEYPTYDQSQQRSHSAQYPSPLPRPAQQLPHRQGAYPSPQPYHRQQYQQAHQAQQQLQPLQQQQSYGQASGSRAPSGGYSPALIPFLNNGRSASVSGGAGAPPSASNGWGSAGQQSPVPSTYNRSGSFSGLSTAHSQPPGYHSPQHLHHTATAPPPNLNAGLGRPTAYLGPPLPPGSASLPPVNSYYGRVLFVGNLPFHCQWQDLKDLFRAAGNIQRADVALTPEGRSRGFGTVLFSSPDDAQNAVRIYHGYEYSGRTLKVHFDRFAQMTAPAPGQLPATPSQYTGAFSSANPPSAPVAQTQPKAPPTNLMAQAAKAPILTQQPSPGYAGAHIGQAGGGYHIQSHEQNQQQQQHQYVLQQRSVQQQQQAQHFQRQQQGPFDYASQGHNSDQSGSYGPRAAQQQAHNANLGGGNPYGNFSSLGYAGDQSQEYGGQYQVQAQSSQNGSGAARPGHIAMPANNFFAVGPLSPAVAPPVGGQAQRQTVPSIPMTPGMPNFTFVPIPQTPPAYPHHMLSPGFGPFSPGLASPHMGGPATPGAGSAAFNPIINPAPGAQLNAGYNPLFPPVGFQQPQGLPQTPHWSTDTSLHQQRRGRPSHNQTQPQIPGEVERQRLEEATTPSANPDMGRAAAVEPSEQAKVADAEDTKPPPDEGYPFPLVQPHLASSLLQRRASTNSPAGSPLPGGPGKSIQSGSQAGLTAAENDGQTADRRGSFDLRQLASGDKSVLTGLGLPSANTEELTRAIARMSVQGTALAKGVGSASGAAASFSATPPSAGSVSSTSDRPRHPLAEQLSSTDLQTSAVGNGTGVSGSALADTPSADGSAAGTPGTRLP